MDRAEFLNRLLHSNIELTSEERRQIIRDTSKSDYWKLKTVICIEELSELQQQLSKHIRLEGDPANLLEEVADVYISLRTIKYLFNLNDSTILKAIDVKLARIKNREERED